MTEATFLIPVTSAALYPSSPSFTEILQMTETGKNESFREIDLRNNIKRPYQISIFSRSENFSHPVLTQNCQPASRNTS